VRILNVLTQQSNVITVCSEETISEIRDRYMEYNKHSGSYTWKRLNEEGAFVRMVMSATLEANGVPDDTDDFEDLAIDEDFYYPTLHLYFNDDLTCA
jgi:hypothetical protein